MSEDFQGSSIARQRESLCLFKDRYFHTSIYLLLYSLECILKAYIERKSGKKPDRTHKIYELIKDANFNYIDLFGHQTSVLVQIQDPDWVSMRYRVNDFNSTSEEDISTLNLNLNKSINYVRKKML